jgi:universal stress protein E
MRRFKELLFVVSADNHDSTGALKRALTLAENNQARLTLVEIIKRIPNNIKLPNSSLSPSALQRKIVASRKAKLKGIVAPLRKIVDIRLKVLVGVAFLEISREVLRSGYDLVIKVAEQDGFGFSRLFGSDDMHLLRKCPCAVLLVKPNSGKTYQRIVAAVDVDDSFAPAELETRHSLNIEILELASSMAIAESADFHIVHAWQAVGESIMQGGFMHSSNEQVAEYVEQARQKSVARMDNLVDEVSRRVGREAIDYIETTKQLLKGLPRRVIPEYVNHIAADSVVMGTVARTGVPGFIMGNTAETILNHINCSVLAIKPQGFVTTITLQD